MMSWPISSWFHRPQGKSAQLKINFVISIKTYIVGSQKHCLNETFLLSTQNMIQIMDKKIFTIFGSKLPLSAPMEHVKMMKNHLKRSTF